MNSYYLTALFLIILHRIPFMNSLSMQYYMFSCPSAESMIKNTIFEAIKRDPTLPAALLRMHFHDCFVQGCDGSILIDSTEGNTAEKDSPANLSLRGFEIIDYVKNLLEYLCPGVVSCADILAIAARDSVYFSGGPFYEILKGRKDGRRSCIFDTTSLPSPTFNASTLIAIFGQHGFSAQEMVVLSGGHTLGVARCASFKNRLTNFDLTQNWDPSFNPNFARALFLICLAGDNSTVAFDRTPTFFDNNYFTAIQTGAGLLFSDQALIKDPLIGGLVNIYGLDRALFYQDFKQAIFKMGLLNVKENGQGEVRKHCRRIN